MRKRLTVLTIVFCLLGIFSYTNKVNAADNYEKSLEWKNLTNPNGVASESDIFQGTIKLTPLEKGISNSKFTLVGLSLTEYEIDETSVKIIGGNRTGESIPITIENGRYVFATGAFIEKNLTYTITFTMHYTKSIGMQPQPVSFPCGSFSGNYIGGGIFMGGCTQIGWFNLYADPQKVFTKSSKNISSVDGKNRVGDSIEYQINVKNNATNASLWDQINISDYIPAGIEIDTTTIMVDGVASSVFSVVGGNLIIPIGDLANGESSKITFRAKILPATEGKRIINTAKVDALQASDTGLLIENKQVSDTNVGKTPIKKAPSTMLSKTTTMKPSVANPKASVNGTVKTMDTTNIYTLQGMLLGGMVIMGSVLRKKINKNL